MEQKNNVVNISWLIEMKYIANKEKLFRIKEKIADKDVRTFQIEGNAGVFECIEIYEYLFDEDVRERVKYEFSPPKIGNQMIRVSVSYKEC